MHELSLVMSIVESVTESLEAYPGATVIEVRLRIGALAAVEEESLQFCFGMASEGTALQGARLVVNRLPVRLYCVPCNQEVELPGVQSMHCPLCNAPAFDIRQGREMEIEAIEIDEIDEVETGGGEAGALTAKSGEGEE